jgi:nucleoside triphosphate pyrophosphatase
MTSFKYPLVLASQSPRRRELLSILGISFSIVPAAIDETPRPEESPEAFVVRVAREKGEEVSSRVSESVIVSADTIVTIDGEILGKPVSEVDAVRMLGRLAGRRHSVYTAVCVVNQVRHAILEGLDRTEVWLNPMTESQILDYVRREDVMDKAGAYAIQGFAAIYIPKIEGNYSNVMGLPLPLVHELLTRT